jgi:hypothetical protein
VNRLDKLGVLGVVTKGQSQIVYVLFNQAFGYAQITPNSVKDFILGQQAVWVINKQL